MTLPAGFVWVGLKPIVGAICYIQSQDKIRSTGENSELRAQSELTDWHTHGLIAIYATSGLEDSLHYCKTKMIIMIKSQQLMKY